MELIRRFYAFKLGANSFIPRSSLLAPCSCLPLIAFITISPALRAEPWLDTRDQYLRADIELLSDVGLISTPITTYPLMWSSIVLELDKVDTSQVPIEYKDVYWRVKKASKAAMAQHPVKSISVSASNSEQVLRSFGDASRGKGEISARSHRLSKNFAWNIEVTQVVQPLDNKKTRYDGSYVAAIIGNWVLSAGYIEKWWGAGWDSTNLLSNNARPPLGVSLQRNYSNKLDIPVIDWVGPWTFNAFVAEIDKDPKAEKDAKLTGVSFNFKPHKTIEIGLRATALWGADDQLNTFDSLLDNFVALEACNVVDGVSSLECDEYYSNNGDRIAGIDFRWRLPVGYPVSLYASQYGEDETDLVPSKTIKQFGVTSISRIHNTNWRWYAEYSETTLDKTEYNRAYESEQYHAGYRFFNRSIGSTYDNDSEIISAGIIATLDRTNKVSLKISNMELNQDNSSFSELALHSVSPEASELKSVTAKWEYTTTKYGVFDFSVYYMDDEVSDLESGFRVDWKYRIN